jgi:hypothetical protein
MAGGRIRYPVDDSRTETLSGDEIVSMNMWGFKPALFEHLRDEFGVFLETCAQSPVAEFMIPTALDRLVAEKKATVRVLRTAAPWVGVTNPGDKAVAAARVEKLVAMGEYPRSLWA